MPFDRIGCLGKAISMEEPNENGFLSNGNVERSNRSRSRADDSSAAIAEKLLQGWALLSDHCPQCVTPLVRSRERRMYCVSCSQWVISERDAATQILENCFDISQSLGEAEIVNDPVTESGNMDNLPPRTTALASAQQLEAEARPNHLSNFRQANEGLLEITQTAVPYSAAGSVPNDVYHVGIDRALRSNDRVLSHEDSGRQATLADLPSNTGTVLSQTLYVLVHKIEEMSRMIGATNEPQILKQLLETIEHCIRVMEQIKAFRTSMTV